MYKKISGIIVIVLGLMLVLYSIMGLPPGTAAADDTVTSTEPETPIETDPEGQVEHTYIITSEDGVLSVTIPEGTSALDSNSNPIASISTMSVPDPPLPPPDVSIVGSVFDLEPSGATFNPAIEITFTYDDGNIPSGAVETDLQLAFYDDTSAAWVSLESTVDTANKTVSAQAEHFTNYAIIVQLSPSPADFTVSDLVIYPSVVDYEDMVNISVNVTNTGGSSGNYTLILKINEQNTGAMTVTLDAGETQTFTFTLVGQAVGYYTADLNGLIGDYEVTESPPPETKTITPPPTTKYVTQTPSGSRQTSTTIYLGVPITEEEEPLSWWLITIIVVGGLVIILVTWRLIHRASQHNP